MFAFFSVVRPVGQIFTAVLAKLGTMEHQFYRASSWSSFGSGTVHAGLAPGCTAHTANV